MAAPDQAYSSQAQSIDWLFAQLPGEATAQPMTGPVLSASSPGHAPAAPPGQNGALSVVWPKPPPALENPSDLQAAHEWLRNERQVLDQYTRGRFAAIHQQHQALLAKHFQSEQTLAVRCQELNREMAFLAAQTEALQRRSRELAEREAALSEQMEQLAQAQEQLLEREPGSDPVREDTDNPRSLLEQMRAQTAQLQASDLAAQREFDNFEATLKERQRAWEKKQEEISARQEAMEQRYAALEKAEEAAKRRLTELDEMEERLQQEVRDQEQQLARERQETELMRANLRALTHNSRTAPA